MKKKDSDIEFYRETLARLQQETASYAEDAQGYAMKYAPCLTRLKA